MLNFPNLLTLSRIAAIPFILFALYFDTSLARWIAGTLFFLAATTDFFDGYLARRENKISPLGRFLDPVADKLLVTSTIFGFVALDLISQWSYVPALIILLREVLISGLREFLAEDHINIPVSQLSKWKTFFQMSALFMLILGDTLEIPWISLPILGEIVLSLAAILTIITGYDYLKISLKHMQKNTNS